MSGSPPAISTPRLCLWAGKYALRRPLPLSAVAAAMLAKVGFDVLRPWPMVFLIDYVLGGKPMPDWVTRTMALLPRHDTRPQLIGWTVALTVLLFLGGWVA